MVVITGDPGVGSLGSAGIPPKWGVLSLFWTLILAVFSVLVEQGVA